ncbi:hypothetical protein PHYC_02299 [Phycisphaerales bacterium]|nr:hypothetical protein PHYC_02299 [Phycisphaerales bacterium]
MNNAWKVVTACTAGAAALVMTVLAACSASVGTMRSQDPPSAVVSTAPSAGLPTTRPHGPLDPRDSSLLPPPRAQTDVVVSGDYSSQSPVGTPETRLENQARVFGLQGDIPALQPQNMEQREFVSYLGTATEPHLGLRFGAAPEFDLQSVLPRTGQGGSGNGFDGVSPQTGFLGQVEDGDGGAGFDWDGVNARAAQLEAELGRLRALEEQRLAAAPMGIRDHDELWVIAKCPPPPERERTRFPGEEPIPGTGCLVTTPPGATQPVPVPLTHTSVVADILGYISNVKVTQQFENPYSGKIEAVYVFPLPENAAVSDFVMTIGSRTIRGVIREREQAERIYAQARAQGYVASLLTQERPNIFTQKIANIEPQHRIDVTIQYFHTLTYSDGAFEFVFPMVVGPRFNPPGTHDGVGAVATGQSGQSGQKSEELYLRPNQRSGHDIDVTVNIDAGVEIERVECASHAVSIAHDTTRRADSHKARVTLSPMDSLPNKDFVLRTHVAGDTVKTAVLTQKGREGGYFTMMIVPPKDALSVPRGPLEVVFVLDASGSMDGRPIEQARAAIERGLARLKHGDTFQLINFAQSATTLGNYPLDATPDNINRARSYLDSIQAAGGTMMMNGLRASLDFPHDPRRSRYVIFVTDGFIGNEREILGALHEKLGSSRIFSFGVGSAPNRALMDSMARMGQGVAAYLGGQDSTSDVMDLFFDRIERAALTDIDLDFGSARVAEVYPSRLPDAFVGRPVIATGRYEGRLPARVKVTGRVGWSRESFEGTVREHDEDLAGKAVQKIWARAKITDISERMAWDNDRSLPDDTRRVALDHGLLSSYTAFVAVDSCIRTDGAYGTTVQVPVPVPEGVRYETTVTEVPRARR